MNNISNQITIITVIYDSSDIVVEFFKELNNFKIIVVDNGKNENILNKIKNKQNVEILHQQKNLGYGRAINKAFEKVTTKYFLILNPDLKISETSIHNLYSVINKFEKCSIVAPLTLPDKDFYGSFPEKEFPLINALEKKSRYLLINAEIEGELCVDIAKGCALLIKSDIFKLINKFDERYFMFWEEIDLCRKMNNKGFSIIISPNSLAKHSEGNSSKKSLKNFFIKNFHREYSPLIYFNVKKFSFFILKKLFKYFLRIFTYALILNFRKSFLNLIKLLANIKYFIDLKFSSSS